MSYMCYITGHKQSVLTQMKRSLHIYNFLNNDVFQPLKIVLILASSADTDEMQLYAALYLGLTVCQSTHLGDSSIHSVNVERSIQ